MARELLTYSVMREQNLSRHASPRLLLLTLVVLTACQAAPNTPRPSANSDGVMKLWSTYRVCMDSSEFEVVERASDQLRVRRLQSEWYAGNHFSPPDGITPFFTQAPSRLAVDLHAMAASCALHAGDIASERGREKIARQLYNEVLNFEEPAYSFYVGQARSRLAQLEGRLEVTLHTLE